MHLALLQHEQHLGVGVVENLVLHRARDKIDVCAHSGLRVGVARGCHRAHTFEEGLRLAR